MSAGIGEAVLASRDVEAARRRAGEEYVAGYIQANEAALREAFVPESTPEDEVPAVLYDMVTKTWSSLAQHHTRPFGVTIAHLVPGTSIDSPIERLGWASWDPCLSGVEKCKPGETFPHAMHLTQKGIDVIDGYRQVLGLDTLDQRQQSVREGWDAAIHRGVKKAEADEVITAAGTV
jgi:hypothetical protein